MHTCILHVDLLWIVAIYTLKHVPVIIKVNLYTRPSWSEILTNIFRFMEDANASFNVPEKPSEISKTGGQDYLSFLKVLSCNQSNKTWQSLLFGYAYYLELMKKKDGC